MDTAPPLDRRAARGRCVQLGTGLLDEAGGTKLVDLLGLLSALQRELLHLRTFRAFAGNSSMGFD
ncbi:hypothetical protein GCM10009767_02410 [Kocuria aegyptia]|uniref:Transposase n=1 Tax=Kocuria aegyptia TaxID=330943 RepID=A0ABN2K2V3_9MICC